MNPTNMRALAAVIIAATLLLGCQRGGAGKPAVPEVTPQGAQSKEKGAEAPSADREKDELKLSSDEVAAAGIMTAVLREQEVSDQIAVTATIEANQDRYASVAPRVSGKVAKVMAGLGDQVRRGQALALIDSIEAGEAQSAYSQATTEYGVAKAAQDRAEKLHADQIIPEKDFLRARMPPRPGRCCRPRRNGVAHWGSLRAAACQPGNPPSLL